MLKKATSFLLTLFMLATLLVGCGDKKETVTMGGSPVTVNGDKIYPLQCDDTLSYWAGFAETLATQYENFGATPIGKELEKRTGVKIEYIHPQAGQAVEQFQIMLTSDDLPDMVQNTWNNFAGGPQAAIDDEYIYNLNDIIDNYAPALKKVLSENEVYDKLSKNDAGNYYAFPFLLQEGILQTFYGPIVREDWLEKAGLSLPETIDEWENVLTVFKNDFGASAPFSATESDLLTAFAPGFNISTGWYLNGDEVLYSAMQPEYKELLKKLNDWYNKGLIDVDFASVTSKVTQQQMLNGETGAVMGYAGGGIGDMLKINADVEGYNLAGAPYPSAEKGKKAEYGKLAAPVNMAVSVAISCNCKNPELAARFLDYGYTEEGHNLFNFGIEGESYEWKDGYPTYTKFITDNPDGLTMTEAMNMYMQSGYSGMFVQDQRYIEQYYKRPQQKEAQKTWAETNMKEHLLPQLYIETEKSDRDSDIMAMIKTYVAEMAVKFINGKESFDNYDAFLEQLDKFGIKEALENRQNAYERYLNR